MLSKRASGRSVFLCDTRLSPNLVVNKDTNRVISAGRFKAVARQSHAYPAARSLTVEALVGTSMTKLPVFLHDGFRPGTI